MALIKAAEVMTSGVPEPKPGVLITLNTPLAETPSAATPKIRLSLSSAGAETSGREASDFPFPRTPAVEPPAPQTPIKLVLNSATAPKEKKKKNVPKAQSRGLSDQDYKTISIVLQKLSADKRSLFFRQPVDPVRDNAPDYLSIITQPMDLATAKAKLDGGMYTSRQEFEEDIRLLIGNCYAYNPVSSPVRKAGESFEKYFNAVWAKTENTLKSSNAPAQERQPAPPQPSVPSALMPPPPVPATGGPMRIKLKPTKSVTIDVPDSSPMPPPPVPLKKTSLPEPSLPNRGPSPAKDKPKPTKKKRENKGPNPLDDELDDLLGAEVDAMEKPVHDPFDDLLPTPPIKKIKLSAKPLSGTSSSKGTPPPERFAPQGIAVRKVKKLSPSDSVSSSGSDRDRLKSSSVEPPARSRLSDKPRSSGEKPRSSGEKPRSSGDPSKSKSDQPLKVKLSNESLKSTASEKPRSTDSSRSLKEERSKSRSAQPGSSSPKKKMASPAPAGPSTQATVPEVAPIAAAGAYAKVEWPKPPADLPATVDNKMPLRLKRSKAMIQVLTKDPNAFFVCAHLLL